MKLSQPIVSQNSTKRNENVSYSVKSNDVDIEDEINPCYSVSNVSSNKSSQSKCSSTSSAHLKTQAELTDLAMKKKISEERHALEEEEEQLRKRK